MRTPPPLSSKASRQSGASDPEHKAAKHPRPAPGSSRERAENDDGSVPTHVAPPAAQTDYDDANGSAGITNLPPSAEKEQQEELPRRGSRKGSSHA